MEIKDRVEIKRILHILFSKKLFIMLIILACITMGYFYSYYYITPEYKSSSSLLLVGSNQEERQTQLTQNDLTLNKNLIETYSNIAKSNSVIEQVIRNLGLNMSAEELNKQIEVSSLKDTQMIQISVVNKNSEMAKNITNELADVFSKEVASIYHINNINVVDRAEVSATPSNINHIKDMVIFTGLGIAISIAFIGMNYFLDNSIKIEKDIEDFTKLKVLGAIPYQRKKQEVESELILQEDKKSHISECFRSIRTNITYINNSRKAKQILVTSNAAGEGKSWVSANLAAAFAQSNKKVILVDCDMRKGRLHHIFKASNRLGLSNCLTEIREDILYDADIIEKYIQETKVANLHIITNGIIPPNPSELLSSHNMQLLLNLLNNMYDVIILDGTPCSLVADSIALSSMVDSTILVAASKKAKIEDVITIKKSIEAVGGNLVGAILNKKQIRAREYKSGYYYGEKSDRRNVTTLKEEQISVKELLDQVRDKIEQGTYQYISHHKIETVIQEDTTTVEADDRKLNLVIQKMEGLEQEWRKLQNRQLIANENSILNDKKVEEMFQDIKQMQQSAVSQLQDHDDTQQWKQMTQKLETLQHNYEQILENQENALEIEAILKQGLEQIKQSSKAILKQELLDLDYHEELQQVNDKLEQLEEVYHIILENQQEDKAQELEEILDEKLEEMQASNRMVLQQEIKDLDYRDEMMQVTASFKELQHNYQEMLTIQNEETKHKIEVLLNEKLDQIKQSNQTALEQQMQGLDYKDEILQINSNLRQLQDMYEEVVTANQEENRQELEEILDEKLEQMKENSYRMLQQEIQGLDYRQEIAQVNEQLEQLEDRYEEKINDQTRRHNEMLETMLNEKLQQVKQANELVLHQELSNLNSDKQVDKISKKLEDIEQMYQTMMQQDKLQLQQLEVKINDKIEMLKQENQKALQDNKQSVEHNKQMEEMLEQIKLLQQNNRHLEELIESLNKIDTSITIDNDKIVDINYLKEEQKQKKTNRNRKTFNVDETIPYEVLESNAVCVYSLDEIEQLQTSN